MDKRIYAIGDSVEKLCAVCSEERNHVVASVSKKGHATRVDCPKCGMRSTFSSKQVTSSMGARAKSSVPYDRTHTYRAGQFMLHSTYGSGEVTAVVDARKIDVLFADRMRRLVHALA